MRYKTAHPRIFWEERFTYDTLLSKQRGEINVSPIYLSSLFARFLGVGWLFMENYLVTEKLALPLPRRPFSEIPSISMT